VYPKDAPVGGKELENDAPLSTVLEKELFDNDAYLFGSDPSFCIYLKLISTGL
jgi:hypothetical protein